jgi:putative tryptophan/tyrosine transport system substrate-binding protein
VELLKEIAPRVARVSLLFNPPTATFIDGYVSPFEAAAAAIGAEAILAPVNDIPGLESLVATEAREPNSGLVVIPDAFTIQHRAEIIALAMSLPFIGPAHLLKSAA